MRINPHQVGRTAPQGVNLFRKMQPEKLLTVYLTVH